MPFIARQYLALTLIFLSTTSVLVGCTKGTIQSRMNTSKNEEQVLKQSNKEIKIDIEEAFFCPRILDQAPTFAVVLLHGLMAGKEELNPIANKIRNKFRNLALIIQPTCRAGITSIIKSTTQQAQDLFDCIQSELVRCNRDPKSFPLIIIGYSHGGVLACVFGDAYKDRLHICGIVTLNAPLMGTPLLNNSYADVRAFISNVQRGLQLVVSHSVCPRSLSGIKWNMSLGACALKLVRHSWTPWVNGLKDILPGSTCVERVFRFLRDGPDPHDIPCLLIGGYQNDGGALFNIDKKEPSYVSAMKQLDGALAQLITGKEGGKHDTLIPLPSQLCRGVSFDDLSTLADTTDPVVMHMPSQPNIKGRIYKDIIHASNVIAIDADLFVHQDAPVDHVLYSDRIATDYIQFITTHVETYVKKTA